MLDHLVAWNAGSTNQQWYAYDASGNRVLLRSTTGTGTSITTYAFGLEEHLYGATGINTGNTYYYHLGGRIIGELTGITTQTTQFFLTDALGSVLATFSAIAGSAAVLGNQIYGPYGNQRYSKGPMGTAKGYTGQYADATGLDYYNARYYDPIVGLFVSADSVQGNEQGMDPYAYVGENPETMTDPSGNMRICSDIASGCSGMSGSGGGAIAFQPPRQNNGGNTGGGSGTMRPPTKSSAGPRSGGSHSGGIRTKSGGLAIPGPRPPTKKNPPIWKAKIGDAQNAAYNAFKAFTLAATGFGLLAAAFQTAVATLGIASIAAYLSEVLAPLGLVADDIAFELQVMAGAAAFLAGESGLLAAMFNYQGSNFSSDWWTERSHVTDFFNGTNQIIDGVTAATTALSFGMIFLSKYVPQPILKIIGVGPELAALGVSMANVQLFRPWNQEAKHNELHAMFGD